MNFFLVNYFEFWNTYMTELLIMLSGSAIVAFCIGWIGRSFKVSRLTKILIESDQDYLKMEQKLKVVEATEKSILFENARMKKIEFDLKEKIKANAKVEKQFKTQIQNLTNQVERLKKEIQFQIIPLGDKMRNEKKINPNLNRNAKVIDFKLEEKQVNMQDKNPNGQEINSKRDTNILVKTEALSRLNLSDSFEVDATKNLTDFAKKVDRWDEEVYFKSYQELIDFDIIGLPDKNNPDDLTRLSGIGIRIEKKMNKLGIYNYFQIKNLRDEDLEIINDAVSFFPERIKLEEWKNEALELLIVTQ